MDISLFSPLYILPGRHRAKIRVQMFVVADITLLLLEGGCLYSCSSFNLHLGHYREWLVGKLISSLQVYFLIYYRGYKMKVWRNNTWYWWFYLFHTLSTDFMCRAKPVVNLLDTYCVYIKSDISSAVLYGSVWNSHYIDYSLAYMHINFIFVTMTFKLT